MANPPLAAGECALFVKLAVCTWLWRILNKACWYTMPCSAFYTTGVLIADMLHIHAGPASGEKRRPGRPAGSKNKKPSCCVRSAWLGNSAWRRAGKSHICMRKGWCTCGHMMAPMPMLFVANPLAGTMTCTTCETAYLTWLKCFHGHAMIARLTHEKS